MRRSLLAAIVLALAAAFLIVAPFGFKPYGIFILSMWAVMTIAAIGLNLTLGYAGQISLAQAAFVGIGAYITAYLTTRGWPFWTTYLIAGVACFAIGWLLGYPALRVQHHYLAFVTLAFNTLIYLVFRNEEWLTGGIYGISNVPRPDVLGWSMERPREFYYFCLAHLALVSLAAWWLIRSPWGRAFVALRENPVRALSLGVDTRRYTLMAFALGAGLGGISGALYAPLVQFIDPTPFALGLSLNLLLMVVVGGSGYFFGPFLGAIVAVLLPEWLRFTEGFYLMGYAVLVIAPDGVLARGPARPGRSPAQAGRQGGGGRIRAGYRAMSAVLAVHDLRKSFGGIVAVDGVSFEVNEGEILGIIGPNGSGKSTLFNCILGQLRPSAGDVHLDGRPVTGMRPCDLNRLGVSRTFQLLQIFPQLTRAREPDPGGPGAPGHHALAPDRPARRRTFRGGRPDARLFPARPSRRRAGRRLELRPAEAVRRRDGVHGRPAPRACSTSRPAAST